MPQIGEMTPPHPSPASPQVMPCERHVCGVHPEEQTPLLQMSPPSHTPHWRVPPQPSGYSPHSTFGHTPGTQPVHCPATHEVPPSQVPQGMLPPQPSGYVPHA